MRQLVAVGRNLGQQFIIARDGHVQKLETTRATKVHWHDIKFSSLSTNHKELKFYYRN